MDLNSILAGSKKKSGIRNSDNIARTDNYSNYQSPNSNDDSLIYKREEDTNGYYEEISEAGADCKQNTKSEINQDYTSGSLSKQQQEEELSESNQGALSLNYDEENNNLSSVYSDFCILKSNKEDEEGKNLNLVYWIVAVFVILLAIFIYGKIQFNGNSNEIYSTIDTAVDTETTDFTENENVKDQYDEKERNSATTASNDKCDVCNGRGYMVCPTCNGKVEIEKEGNYYLCETCTVDEGAECPSSSRAAMRIMEMPDTDYGNVKCPYCNTKTRKKYKAISKAKYERLKR